MNKAFYIKRCISSFMLIGCLILFNPSCGLDTFYVIDAPVNAVHTPSCESGDYTENYFDFYTMDRDYDSVKFLGTEVYYKIYKSSARLNTEADDLVSIATKSDNTAAAAERMVQTYKFQPLRAYGHEGDNVLFPTTGSNQRINIRLSTYTVYPAQISINGGTSIGRPVRYLDKKPTFQFIATDSDSIPKSEDVDVNTNGTSTDENMWYVSLFAVAIGQDATYSTVYSNVLYLGSVQIPVEQ